MKNGLCHFGVIKWHNEKAVSWLLKSYLRGLALGQQHCLPCCFFLSPSICTFEVNIYYRMWRGSFSFGLITKLCSCVAKLLREVSCWIVKRKLIVSLLLYTWHPTTWGQTCFWVWSFCCRCRLFGWAELALGVMIRCQSLNRVDCKKRDTCQSWWSACPASGWRAVQGVFWLE